MHPGSWDAQKIPYGHRRDVTSNGMSNRKHSMFLNQSFANSKVPSSLLRKRISEGIELAWADTVPGALDPLRKSDLANYAAPAYDTFALTMPMALSAK
jgi:hypothetical protein